MRSRRVLASIRSLRCRPRFCLTPRTREGGWRGAPGFGTKDEVGFLSLTSLCVTDECAGYNVLQSTKPQTISYALHDSPVALLAWIYEKLHDWSDAYAWTDDEILTWISIYAFSRAGPGAAHRIYYESFHEPDGKYIGVRDFLAVLDYTKGLKVGLTYNPKEIDIMPTAWGKALGEVVHTARNEKGG